MDDSYWNTGWDPYQELLQAKANIHQLAAAYNAHQDTINRLTRDYKHQQEVIQQLMFQNQKLNELIKTARLESANVGFEVEKLKLKENQA